jgi:hypothetical protein
MLNLCQVALDMLAIPPMSFECERFFSSFKLKITTLRDRLNASIVEALTPKTKRDADRQTIVISPTH